MRISAIRKIVALRDYWSAVADEAYAKAMKGPARRKAGMDPIWCRANAEIGALLMPFERLTRTRWEKDGGINDPKWRLS